MDDVPIKLCECGCGQPTRLAPRTRSSEGAVKGQPLRFINGHNRRIPRVDGKKRCPDCQTYKDTAEYNRNGSTADGLTTYCRTCLPERKTKRYRLVSKETHESMVEEQDGRCAICGNEPTERDFLGVDHNHTSGKVRGLLCRCCNLGLGYFKDNPAYLSGAILYLERTDG